MLLAIIVILATIVVLAVVALIIFRVRSQSSKVGSSKKMRVNSISSVGVSSHMPKVTSGSPTVVSHSPYAGSSSAGAGDRSRFLAIGVLVAGVFAALTAKLFSLQIVSSAQYREEATENLYTTVKTPAPRGVIYDADGIALVTNRQVQTVLADAEVANNHDVLLRLSALLGLPYDVVRNRVLDSSSGAQSQRVVASDVSLRETAFIAEHIDAFPGVTTQMRTTRSYPYGALAAHLLGYTGTASEEDLSNASEGQDIESGDAVGKSGVEQTYNSVLSGDHGQRVLITDASGTVQQVVSETAPSKGSDVYLTVSAKVQHVADLALKDLIDNKKGTAASLVCMDVETGGIVALSNYPTYEPEHFIGGISQEVWDEYQTEESHYPLMNRAIAGTYPAASCFKAFTGLAGLTYGFADSEKTWLCSGTWTGFGEEYPQNCWELNGHGYLGIRQGIVVSCDVVFYEIARDFYNARQSIGNDAMQDFIKEFGYAKVTGIDLSGEAEGRIPTPEWKANYFRDVPAEAQWLPGDMSNMSIGQGYVLVTPIQVVRAYAAVATGRLLKPHLLREVRNSQGDIAITAQTVEDSRPDVDEANYKIMRDALNGVTLESADVAEDFGGLDFTAAAKTGTAEVAGKQDLAWFACYAPYEKPRFAIAMCVEEGGSGGSVASPVAAKVMDAAIKFDNKALDEELSKITTGEEETSDASNE